MVAARVEPRVFDFAKCIILVVGVGPAGITNPVELADAVVMVGGGECRAIVAGFVDLLDPAKAVVGSGFDPFGRVVVLIFAGLPGRRIGISSAVASPHARPLRAVGGVDLITIEAVHD